MIDNPIHALRPLLVVRDVAATIAGRFLGSKDCGTGKLCVKMMAGEKNIDRMINF
jgi:hypothetical protein